MPTPTRKRKSSTASKTRKSASSPGILETDALLKGMANGKLLWGDMLRDDKALEAAAAPSPAAASVDEMLEGWSIPDLTTHRGIWEHFPVSLVALGRPVGGKQRYAVCWHKAHLKEWREKRAASWDEYMEYQTFAEYRLLHALRAHGYTIEPPRADDQILVLVVSADAASASPVPPLVRLTDIRTHFPMAIWNRVEGAPGETTYAIAIRGDYRRRVDGRELARTEAQLRRALAASRFWTVLPAANRDEFVRIQMRHD